MSRTTRLLSVLAAATLLVAACGSSTPSTAPTDAATVAPTAAPATPDVVPTEAPASDAPSGNGFDVSGAAGALESIEKYQIDMTLNGLVPGATGEVTMSGVIDQTADAYQFEMTGFAALPGATAFSIIVIGDDAWINAGGATYIKQVGGAAAFESMRSGFAPSTLLASVPTTGVGWNKVGDETRNGVGTAHYHVDAGTVPTFAAELGPDAAMDIWVADEGGYLVSMNLTGTQAGADVSMSMDLSRVNDPSISIEEPN